MAVGLRRLEKTAHRPTAISGKPESWKDLYFPEAHGGSSYIRLLYNVTVRQAVGRERARDVVPAGVPVQDALLQLVAGSFVKAAATGSLKAELWGPIDRTPAIARVLFLGGNA